MTVRELLTTILEVTADDLGILDSPVNLRTHGEGEAQCAYLAPNNSFVIQDR